MGFTRLAAIGGMATKGQWAIMTQKAIEAKVRQESTKRTPRNTGAPNGQKNKAALAKALAGLPAHQPTQPAGPKPKPSNAAANKARLANLLADD